MSRWESAAEGSRDPTSSAHSGECAPWDPPPASASSQRHTAPDATSRAFLPCDRCAIMGHPPAAPASGRTPAARRRSRPAPSSRGSGCHRTPPSTAPTRPAANLRITRDISGAHGPRSHDVARRRRAAGSNRQHPVETEETADARNDSDHHRCAGQHYRTTRADPLSRTAAAGERCTSSANLMGLRSAEIPNSCEGGRPTRRCWMRSGVRTT